MTSSNDWSPPGPGQWTLDRSHYPGGTTPISQWLIESGMESGLGRVFRELGAPVAAVCARFVHGFMYTRTVPLVGASRSATTLPPLFVLKAASRLHPEFRRRNRTATQTLAQAPGPAIVERWTKELKPTIDTRNREFGAVTLGELDDRRLGDHCAALLRHVVETFDLHFWLHGYDLGPIARYVAFTKSHGIATSNAVTALVGASPSTLQPRLELAAIRAALGDAKPNDLAELRSVSAEVAGLLDAYVTKRGNTLATGYDLNSLTLRELPETLFDSIMSAQPPSEADAGELASENVRELVPESAHGEFNARLAEAREVMDMRDDNGPTTVEHPMGLLRLALLEVGRRLVSADRADRAEHAIELAHNEVVPLLVEGRGPSREDLRARVTKRLAESRLTPPVNLGPVEPSPPPSILPGPLAEFATAIQVSMFELGMLGPDTTRDPLSGTGVGSEIYQGRARCAETPEAAIDALEPGDVLVVRATTPAFNAVLSIAGAVVTADGGPMSHAAVLARELGIAAVVGARGALEIPDGAMVEVDPVAGVVRILPSV